MNDNVYKLFEILFNVREYEWIYYEIVLLSIISKEMRNLVMDSSLKINFIMMYQRNNERFQQIFNSLKRNNLFRNVISVHLFNNDGIGVIQTITDEELNLQNIVSVDIGNNLLGGNNNLAKRLSLCPLTTLEVNNNNFNSEFFKHLFTNTKKNFSNLVFLNISANKIEVEGAKIIASQLPDLQNLKKFNISNCNIGKEGAKIIASYIEQCTKITNLNLSFNDIGTEVAISFLEKCTGLVSLNLRENCISDKEDKEFASKLNCLTRLKKLNLADNCILKPSKFSEALKNLKLLNLSGTDFNDLALQENTTLLDLNLSGNDIERDAAEHIIFSLNCTNLFSLDISENQIDDGVEGIVDYCQKKFRALKYLDTDDNMSWNKRYGFN